MIEKTIWMFILSNFRIKELLGPWEILICLIVVYLHIFMPSKMLICFRHSYLTPSTLNKFSNTSSSRKPCGSIRQHEVLGKHEPDRGTTVLNF